MDASFLAVPDGAGPFPGVVVIHEASGLNDNIKDVCRRLCDQEYVAMGVDLFDGRSRAVCMARMLAGALAGNLDHARPSGGSALSWVRGRARTSPPERRGSSRPS